MGKKRKKGDIAIDIVIRDDVSKIFKCQNMPIEKGIIDLGKFCEEKLNYLMFGEKKDARERRRSE